MDIYKLPKILLIHLKRFKKEGDSAKSSSYFHRQNTARKIKNLVEFPIFDLDMSPFTLHENEEGETYDLNGVIHHMGSLHGGHYTASVKSPMMDEWLYCDDSKV
jgi:ubiquitin C-terminal hydrolase